MRVGQNEPLERVMKDGRFTMNKRDGYAPVLTIFNLENQYLKDQRVRYAYAHAIDHATVQKTIDSQKAAEFTAIGRAMPNAEIDGLFDTRRAR